MAVFTGKVVVVTGASEGIGRALCRALAPQGPRLVLAARNEDRLKELAAEVERLGAQALVVRPERDFGSRSRRGRYSMRTSRADAAAASLAFSAFVLAADSGWPTLQLSR